MYFRILGPIEAGDGTAIATLGSPKQRALLAILLVHLGEIVSTDRLIDLLWGDSAPRTAAHSIQIYVSELRKAFGPLGGDALIATRPPGYQLLAGPETVDAVAFERLVDGGVTRIRAGDPSGADALRDALRMWRGPALSDFVYDDFAQPFIYRLNSLRLDAIEELAAADLEGRRTSEVLAPLEAAIREDPLRERSRELLMLALYRSGRHAEALRTFQRLRELLADELGLDPSPSLLRLQERILVHDPTLLLPAEVEVDVEKRVRRNPYKGLKAFTEADAPDFFGRDALVDRLVRMIQSKAQLIALVGPSGSGKSSVVAAGLVPRLRAGAIAGSERWVIATFVPGSNPVAEANAAVARAAGERADEAASAPADEATQPGLRDTGDDRPLLLVVDQFEEVFVATDEAARRRFLGALAAAVTSPARAVTALLTLRADFYDRPLLDPEFASIFTPGVVNVVPMSAIELEAAVSMPAERVGVNVESSLLAELVAETADRPGGLPLLQYALTELFDQQSDETLALRGYRAFGGLRGILSHRAESLYAELDDDAQRAAMQVFMRLVRLGPGSVDSRRRIQVSELTDLDLDPVALSSVLQAFGSHRFLSFDRDQMSGQSTVEVAHEALFREWDRLHGWIERHRAAIRRHEAFQAAVEEWELAGRAPDYLLSGSRLADFDAWSRDGVLRLTGKERQFLDAGLQRQAEEAERAARQRHFERRSRLGLAAMVVIAVGLGAGLLLAVGGILAPRDRVALLHWAASDFGFAYQDGFDRAITDFGLVGTDRLATTEDGGDDLRTLSSQGNKVILSFSVPADVFTDVVRSHPETQYVTFDRIGAEPNVTYILFDDHESSFLAGAAAALTTRTGTVGFVGGVDVDIIWRFQAGFEAGAREIDPEIDVLTSYLADDSSGFQSPELGKAAAEAMFEQGADVIFEAAGSSGFGGFEAASELSASSATQLWAIGVDSDQYLDVALNPAVVDPSRWQRHILTSVVKRWDQAIYATLADFADGSLQPGVRSLDLGSGGVDISFSGGFLDDARARIEELRRQIIAGQIAVPCLPAEKEAEAKAQGVVATCRR